MILFNKNQKTGLSHSSKMGVDKVQNAVSEKSENSSSVLPLWADYSQNYWEYFGFFGIWWKVEVWWTKIFWVLASKFEIIMSNKITRAKLSLI